MLPHIDGRLLTPKLIILKLIGVTNSIFGAKRIIDMNFLSANKVI